MTREEFFFASFTETLGVAFATVTDTAFEVEPVTDVADGRNCAVIECLPTLRVRESVS